METGLLLLLALGLIGAFDTLWFHEWRARLVAQPTMREELRLHVARDAIYVVLFATLGRVEWHGAWAAAFALLLAAEIAITLVDFVTEDRVRAPLGGVFAGERITHAVMGIVYGAVLAHLVPQLHAWSQAPTALVRAHDAAPLLGDVLALLALGIAAHGLRDLAAVIGVPGSDWPWRGRLAPPGGP